MSFIHPTYSPFLSFLCFYHRMSLADYLDLARENKLTELQDMTMLHPEFASMRCPEMDNKTALMLASIKGHEDMVRYLLLHGAVVNAQDNINSTALHYACCWKREAFAQLLIEAGADVTMKDKHVRNLFSGFLLSVSSHLSVTFHACLNTVNASVA